MSTSKSYDVAVLGAGPSGLTAAYCLGKAGAKVAVLERGAHCGGLMRGIRRGEFRFDLGRKELYARFPEVHQLWTELLGEDYREYPHRVGVLHGGRILEKSSGPQGRLRGLSAGQLAQLAGSYLRSQLRGGSRNPQSAEDYFVLRYGRAYYRTFVHGFNLKFDGFPPTQAPSPEGDAPIPRFGFLRRKAQVDTPKLDALYSGQPVWRHPAKGTQQIVDRLEQGCRSFDVDLLLNTEVKGIEIRDGEHTLAFCQDGTESAMAAHSIVSSVPLPFVTSLLASVPAELKTPPAEEALFKKSTSLVYLLLNRPPRFPHNWLEVTDTNLHVGRIVNYGTWNGDMVPPGKAALCLEFFALEGDPVLQLSQQELLQLAIKEASANGLLDPADIVDQLVISLPKVNASTVIGDRKQAWLQAVSSYLDTLPRFYETSRPGMDRATLAGIDAAQACLAGTPMRRRSLAMTSSEL